MKMQYGYTDYNGNIWHNSAVDTYNVFDDEVTKRDEIGLHPNSLAYKELEFYRDQRHQTFTRLVSIFTTRAHKTILTNPEYSHIIYL